MSSYESKMMWTTKFALLAMCVVTIASTDFGARLVAQELIAQEHGSMSIFERVQTLPVAPAAADSKEFEYHGIVRKPDFSEAQAIVFCVSVEPTKKTLLGRTTTDSHGHFSLSFSASEEQSKSLQVFAIDLEDRLGWYYRLSKSTPYKNIPLLLHENSGRIAGNLSAPHGESVDGIPIKVRALLDLSTNASGCDVDFEPFEFKTVSDANGDFTIDGLPASMHALVKIEAEELDNQQPVIATSVDTPISERDAVPSMSYFPGFAKIKLFPKHVLHGTVVDSQGNPIAGVHIGNQPFTGPEAVSDAEGRFTIRRLNPTALGPSVPKNYFEAIRVKPPTDSRFAPTFLRLERQQFIKDTLKPIVLEGAWVSGRLLSATTKQPFSGIQVGEKRHGVLQTTDGDGRFRISLDAGPHDIQFSPNWMSGAEADQFLADPKSRAVRTIDVLDGEPVDMGNVVLDIDIEAAKPVTVKVVLADGSPAANCRLEFLKADSTQLGVGSRRSQVSLVQDKAIAEHVVTDDQGLAVIKPAMGWSEADIAQDRPLPPDVRRRMRQLFSANTLTASYPAESPRHFGRLEIPNEIPDAVVELTLEEGAYLHGNITLNGSPLEGVEASARFIGPAPFPGSETLTAITDAEGNYAIYAPRSVGYSLSSIKGFPLPNWSTSLGEKRAQPIDRPLEFEFPQIDFLAGSRKISGQVVDAEGNPVEGASISCATPPGKVIFGGYGRTNAQGKFMLVNLPQDSLTLEVKSGRPLEIRASVVVEAQQNEIKIELP